MTRLQLLVPLALTMGATMPALAQSDTDPATQQFNTICEIELEVLADPVFADEPITFDEDETTLFTTFTTRTLCTGSLANENIKRECQEEIPDWSKGFVEANGFPCRINVDFCDVTPPADDPFFPAATATDSSLTVDETGFAMLTCFFRP